MKKMKQKLVRDHSPPKHTHLHINIINLNHMKTFFVSMLLVTTISTNAQITKGNWLIGGNGNLSFSKSKSKENNGSVINYVQGENIGILLEPNVGYFIKDKFALGLKLGLENNFNNQSSFQLNQTQLSIGPFARYYFLDIEKPYNLFIEPSYYRYTYKPLGNSDGFGLKFGHVFFLNSSVGIETSLNYQFRENNELQTNSFFLAFGFQFYLEKNH